MSDIRPRETVLLATEYPTLVAWYSDVLGFRVVQQFDDKFHYTNLETASGIRLGVAPATEMGVTPPEDRSQNSVVLQIEVDDVSSLFDRVSASAGRVVSGPSFDKSGGFWFGSIADPEGNPIWVVDSNCP